MFSAFKDFVTVYESVKEYDYQTKENLRKQALEKLTQAEREALGV